MAFRCWACRPPPRCERSKRHEESTRRYVSRHHPGRGVRPGGGAGRGHLRGQGAWCPSSTRALPAPAARMRPRPKRTRTGIPTHRCAARAVRLPPTAPWAAWPAAGRRADSVAGRGRLQCRRRPPVAVPTPAEVKRTPDKAAAAASASAPARGKPSDDPLGDFAAACTGRATQVTPAPAPAPAAAPAADPFTYFVQAGAFRTREDAEGQRAPVADRREARVPSASRPAAPCTGARARSRTRTPPTGSRNAWPATAWTRRWCAAR